MYSAAENAFLAARNIRLLALARQTGHVNGTAAAGAADAQHNVDAILAEIPVAHLVATGQSPMVFLDVEQGNPLSQDYYQGWADTLVAHSAAQSGGQFSFRPALYAVPGSAPTWTALAAAMAAGSACAGAWIARYPHVAYQTQAAWNPALVTPAGGAPVPLFAWQYWECPNLAPPPLNFDTTLVNPDSQADFLDGLIQTPA
jgi:hypothetical protein